MCVCAHAWHVHIHVYAQLLNHPTIYNPVDCSPPGSSFHGILQQVYWSGLPFPSPGDLPNPGIEPISPALSRFFTTEPPWKPNMCVCVCVFIYTHICLC